MPNNYLSVLYKHIIQVENKNVGLNVWGTNRPLPPNQKMGWGGGGGGAFLVKTAQILALVSQDQCINTESIQ